MLRRMDGSWELNPGLLRHAVTIQRCTKTQGPMGEDIQAWDDLISIHAQIRALQGREMEAYQQTWAEARFKVRTWLPSVEVRREDRILWGDRVLDILDAEDPDGTGRTLEIVAREVVP